ncbi:creatininase family protein [Streptomyces sp. 21So2-11]|uniref:creatininase family protein n=1 Tax=Streptomyces sp. 21So2-11 TaxID=3144408 RepID=UPI00321BC5FF
MTRQRKESSLSLLPGDTTDDTLAQNAYVAVLPIGSFEQHGQFLPLATDTLIASAIAHEIAQAYPVLRLPPLTVSCSHEHESWPGTVSISAATLYAVVRDISQSLHRRGIDRLVLLNAHGGNYVLRNIVQESAPGPVRMALFPGPVDWDTARSISGVKTSAHSDMHAGEVETSILLHAFPETVRPGYENADHIEDDRKHLLTLGMAAYSASGVIGRPSLASAAKGREMLAALVESFGEYMTLLANEEDR